MKILLIGIGGVYNYGCEAIVRGTEKILRSTWPDIHIVYASRRPDDDRARLAGCDIEIVHRKRLGRYSLKRIAKKFLSLFGIRWSPMEDPASLLRDCDAVLSIGGDIYTLDSSGGYAASLTKFGDNALKKGIPYILWGASAGPFSENPEAEKLFREHLKKASLIAAREAKTIECLRSLGVSDNVFPCADPAYAVAPEIKADHASLRGDRTIGVNLSPLSAGYSGISIEDSVRAQSKAVESLIETFNARILLVPHVVCGFKEEDDDLRYLRRIWRTIAPEYRDKVRLLDGDPGFIAVKRELINCNLVIAARMHCAVNALAAHVPAVILSYSDKAVGMCRYVYGNDDWVIPVSEFSRGGMLENKVRSMLDREGEIRTYLDTRIPEVRQHAYQPIQQLRKLL